MANTETLIGKERRKEFAKERRALVNKYNLKPLICARCGCFELPVHLHHIKGIVSGGANRAENMVPLCFSCHHDWDSYEKRVSFGEFLISPATHRIANIIAQKIDISSTSAQSLFETIYRTQFGAKAMVWNEHGRDDIDYDDELERQNEIFHTAT